MSIPVAARSKAWVCGRSLAGILGSNPPRGYGFLSLLSVVCCQVEVFASGWSLVQGSPTKCVYVWMWSWTLGNEEALACWGLVKKQHNIRNIMHFQPNDLYVQFNPLKPELNPICYLLALLGAHHFLHVSRTRVKLLTFRLLMSYIYGAPILDVSRSHTTTHHIR